MQLLRSQVVVATVFDEAKHVILRSANASQQLLPDTDARFQTHRVISAQIPVFKEGGVMKPLMSQNGHNQATILLRRETGQVPAGDPFKPRHQEILLSFNRQRRRREAWRHEVLFTLTCFPLPHHPHLMLTVLHAGDYKPACSMIFFGISTSPYLRCAMQLG